MFFFVERIADASWMFESTHLREWRSRQIDMHNVVTKWCSRFSALHSESTVGWKFEDTTNPKIHSTTVRKYFTSGATSHPEIRHTGLPYPHHAPRPMGACTISANVVVSNAKGAVRSPTREKRLIDLFLLADKTRP